MKRLMSAPSIFFENASDYFARQEERLIELEHKSGSPIYYGIRVMLNEILRTGAECLAHPFRGERITPQREYRA